MKKTLLAFILSVVMVCSSISYNTIHAQAVFTSSAGVYEGIMLLLGLSGLRATSKEFINSEINLDTVLEDIKTNQKYGVALYLKMLDTANKIAAGATNVTIGRDMYEQLKEYVQETFGIDTTAKYAVGRTRVDLSALYVSGSTHYFVIDGYDRATVSDDGYSYLGVTWYQSNGYRFAFVPSVESVALMQSSPPSGVAWFSSSGTTTGGVVYGGTLTGYTFSARTKVYYNVTDSNVTWLNIDDYVNGVNVNNFSVTLNNFNTAFYSGALSKQDTDVYVTPMTGIDGVATSVDQSVVGAGTLVDEENGDVVIGGDIALNLQNIDIQALLRSLADGQITYQQLVDALGLTAVNTATMTAEAIEALAQAQTIAQTGVGQITGNYTVDLTQFFPFCIPFDLYHLIQAFNATPVAPEVTITLPVGYDGETFTWEDYTISLSDFEPVAQVVRILEYVLFIIGLMMVTRKLIEG